MSQVPSQPLLAMIALKGPSLPSPSMLLADFEAFSGITIDIQSLQSKLGNLVFDVGNDKAAIALMPSPMPWSNLEGPCATAYWWPEAVKEMQSHTSHILVALVGPKGNMIQRCIALTQLTASVALRTEAVGVYWGGGTLVHDPKSFIEQAKHVSTDDIPLNLWIDFRLEENADDSHRLFTTGMKLFGHEEMEILRSTKPPADILNFAYSIADYVLTSAKNPQDGDTIGRSANEKVQIHYAPSMLDPRQTATQLDF